MTKHQLKKAYAWLLVVAFLPVAVLYTVTRALARVFYHVITLAFTWLGPRLDDHESCSNWLTKLYDRMLENEEGML
jgi:hypothetical protein